MKEFSEKNYFALLNIALSFEVDASLLEKHYQIVQAQIHPDRFSGQSAQQQRVAMQMASLVNDAYQTLKSDERRAIYLLDLLSDQSIDLEKSAVSPMFLMEQMELREQQEALPVLSKTSSSSDIDVVGAFCKQLETMSGSIVKKLSASFSELFDSLGLEQTATSVRALPVGALNADQKKRCESIAELIQELRYIGRLQGEGKQRMVRR